MKGVGLEKINFAKAQKFKIYKDAQELTKIAQAMQKFEDSNAPKKETGFSYLFQPIVDHSYVLSFFIAKIITDEDYQDKMEMAFRIRESGMELERATNAYFAALESKPRLRRYQAFILEKIEDFRWNFVDFVKTFDEDNFTPDAWGIFNPPGINSQDFYK